MSRVLVVDAQRRPLMPCTPARARLLLRQRKAAVLRRFPFVLILKETKQEPVGQPLRLKLDPGSKTTGVAVVNDASGEVVWAAEITHRGDQVQKNLLTRRSVRRRRRQRHTRYRQARWRNRRRPKGWLPPSLRSRIQNVLTWVIRLSRFCPIGAISLELVRFDTQLLQNPSIECMHYQRGTLWGTEVRQYLLAKWEHRCAYCTATGLPLEIDHVVPQSRGGSDRVVNLVIACRACNLAKGDKLLEDFLADHTEVLARVQAQRKALLKDAAIVNSTRWAIHERAPSAGPSAGNQLRWAHQMEQAVQSAAEKALDRCGLLRTLDAPGASAANGAPLVDRGQGSPITSNGQHG